MCTVIAHLKWKYPHLCTHAMIKLLSRIFFEKNEAVSRNSKLDLFIRYIIIRIHLHFLDQITERKR